MGVSLPSKVENFIGGNFVAPVNNAYYPNLNPHNSENLGDVAKSSKEDAQKAIAAAKESFAIWSETPTVKRGMVLYEIARLMEEHKESLAEVVAVESGKAFNHALGEVGAAIQQAYFMGGEGQRMYGKTTGSNNEYKNAVIVREPVGVCALIVASNTPIANIAWKVFPALICGNSVVLKASEDTPLTAWYFSTLIEKSSLPKGVFNMVQGLGPEIGEAISQSDEVDLVSFTGSTRVGKIIGGQTGGKLKKTFLELGGKNPMVICDDADLENATNWAVASSFSNAGQRCAASSRIIVMEGIYDKFKELFLEKTKKLTLGTENRNDLGPVINKNSQTRIVNMMEQAKSEGATILIGGGTPEGSEYSKGSYIAPTIIENAKPDAKISREEVFGPVTCMYKVKSFTEAIELANNCDFGLTSCIHTKNYHRIMTYQRKARAGVVSINAGTHGSEPHIPFGGVKDSGAGGREPGTEALDVYTNLKVVFNNFNPELI